MTARRGLAAAAALACAAAATGCGFGAGPSSSGEATLTVTRDYGSQRLVESTESNPPASETVLRFLDREAGITTRYGGGFVQSIDGVSGGEQAGRRYDWFFYVNGIESPVGAAEVQVHGGDRIWWDYRDWTDAMRVPAVVGSWPEPFAQSSAGADRLPVAIDCFDVEATCRTVARRLAQAGVDAGIEKPRAHPSGSPSALRLLVGPWKRVREDPAASQLDGGPATSGVFASFQPAARGGFDLEALDSSGHTAADLGSAAGLVAALRRGDDPATWIVTGSTKGAVGRAAGALDEASLRDRYAVAVPAHGAPVSLPVAGGGEG